MEARGSRIGLDPIDRVFLMENHDEAYHIWQSAGLKQRVLVHIDAHHDLWWVKDTGTINIANFICPALKEGIVREVFWVVPDPTWETAASRKAVLRHVREIAKRYPEDHHGCWVRAHEVSTVVLGKPLRVCPLASLPRIEESVILDVDVDFFVIPRLSYGESDAHGAIPWCWPDDLLARLRAGNLRAELATIVYSVQGGYTPLKWKYLGDELAVRLKQPNQSQPILQGMALVQEAALAAQRGDVATAEEKYQAASRLLPASPVPSFHLAHLYVDRGRIGEGQKFYQQALASDPTYRTPYNSAGLQYHADGRLQAAEREYQRTLLLDPQDAYAHFGLGRLAAQRKRWSEAEALLRKALALDGQLIDAYRALGNVLVKQGRHDEAIAAYGSSLKLALAGRKPLAAPVATFPEPAPPLDRDHCRIYARLARLYEMKGATTEAINAYRISIAGGHDGFFLRSRLAYLYLKQCQWVKAGPEFWQALKRVPRDLRKAGHRLRQGWRQVLRARYAALLAFGLKR